MLGMDEGLLNKIQELIEKRVGDIPRIEDIKERLEAGKKLYSSDQDYINEILSKYGLVDTTARYRDRIQPRKRARCRGNTAGSVGHAQAG